MKRMMLINYNCTLFLFFMQLVTSQVSGFSHTSCVMTGSEESSQPVSIEYQLAGRFS